jgi:ParB-like chromosome segregation protein Spo0J
MKKISINKIKMNPNNPRIIKDHKFNQLVNSIKQFPQMLEKRPIVVNGDMIVLGGNMRLRACQEAGLKEVPVIIADDWTEEQQREFIIKDNLGYGEWDFDMLSNDWNTDQLQEWGVELPTFKETEEKEEAEYNEEDKAWFLNIRFDSEQACQEWYQKLIEEGLDIKIVS